MRMALVTHEDRPLPVLFMRYPVTCFRTNPDAATPVSLLIDVVSVFPYPYPIAFAMPIIWDDDADPYWSFLFLSLFPISTVGGVAHLSLPGGDPLLPRKLLRCCSARRACGLVLMDPNYRVRKATIVPMDSWVEERPSEMEAVIDLLDTREIALPLEAHQGMAQLINQVACFNVQRPDGKTAILPRGRWPQVSRDHVYALTARNGRLVNRESSPPEQLTKQYDVFVSHAHADSAHAQRLATWLSTCFPSIRIFLTDPSDKREFQQDPAFFFRKERESNLVILVTSANSLSRPIVSMEVGLELSVPVLPVLIGGLSKGRIRAFNVDHLFVQLDEAKAIDLSAAGAASELLQEVGRACGLEPSPTPPPLPELGQVEASSDETAADDGYVEYWESVLKKKNTQTAEEAEAKLNKIIQDVSGSVIPARNREVLMSLEVNQRLALLLHHWDAEAVWLTILDWLPGLRTRKLIRAAEMLGADPNFPESERERLGRLLKFLRAAVD